MDMHWVLSILICWNVEIMTISMAEQAVRKHMFGLLRSPAPKGKTLMRSMSIGRAWWLRARILDGTAAAALMLVLCPSVSKPMHTGDGHYILDVTPSSSKIRWLDVSLCSAKSTSSKSDSIGRKGNLLVASVSAKVKGSHRVDGHGSVAEYLLNASPQGCAYTIHFVKQTRISGTAWTH